MSLRLRTFVITLAAAVGLGALLAGPAAALEKPRVAMLVRINEARAAHGLRAVRPAFLLREAAQHHSDDMILRDYFAHVSPSGGTLYRRVERSGFVAGYSWMAGETLGWGVGALAKPAATVAAWLASPEHRAIMLSSTFTRVGISRACGHFLGHLGACVWTADWVRRW